MIAVIAAGIALVWVNQLGLLNPVKAVLSYALTPVQRLFAGAGSGVGGFFGTVTQIRTLADSNAQLEQQVGELHRRLSDDTELRRENESLRRQLNFGTTAVANLIPAQVVAYQSDNFRQFLTINRGSRDGLKEGMAVVSEGYLVGKITEVMPASSKVFLVVDPAFRVNAIDQTSRASGTIHGQIGNGLVMDKVAQSDTITVGDTIITSGLAGDLPPGLLVGQVESVSSKDNAVFQSAQVTSSLKFSKLELVFAVGGS